MLFATILAVLFAAILGAVACFLGYRFFLVMLPVWGFFGGFWLADNFLAGAAVRVARTPVRSTIG